MDDNRILPFTSRTGRGSGNGQEPPNDDELVEAGNAYAVTRGLRAPPALRFRWLNGRNLAMPYAHPPIVWGESSSLVLLEYPGCLTVILSGKNLGPLEARLCDQRVTWIRECGEAEAASLPVAVTRIELMHRYPSHEPDAAGSDN